MLPKSRRRRVPQGGGVYLPRLGLGRGSMKPHEVAGYGLMGVGGLVVLFSLPFYFWTAAFGGFLAFLGYTVQRQRA